MIVPTPEEIKPISHKGVFVRKWNENSEIIRYKARLVAQGFSQMPGVNYEETYSPVIIGITVPFFIVMRVSNKLDMQLINVVTAYVYGLLEKDIYMKIYEGYKITNNTNCIIYTLLNHRDIFMG